MANGRSLTDVNDALPGVDTFSEVRAAFRDLIGSMNGHTALTAEDDSTVDTTYGSEEAAVIDNLRTRVGEIEAILQAIGILSEAS